MKSRRSLTMILACFMLTSTIGVGFTGRKVNQVSSISLDAYMENIDKENNNAVKIKKAKSFTETFESNIDINIESYSLKVNGSTIANLRTKEEIQEILKELTSEFANIEEGQAEIKELYILEKLKIIKEDVHLDLIKTKEETINYIRTGSEELKDAKPLITVVTEQEVTSTKQTEYIIEVKEDPEMFDIKSETTVIGEQGENKLLTKHINYNGELAEEEILSEEVVRAPINQIVIKGTKPTPKTQATGKFEMPTRGRISSHFGGRWGRMHRGIDIAKEPGSDIIAADGGTITFSGFQGTYGKMIEIDHGNGYKTRYAHSSQLLLNVGAKVYKGQVIAKVGNTGRSTGPHLHFEVIKDGQHLNPLDYVN